MLAVLPTLIAIVAGVVLGVSGGGRLDRLLRWRPVLWELAVGAVAIQMVFRILPISGGFAVVLDLVSVGLALAFAVANVRIPGMVLIVVALVLHAVPVVVNWGMPVRPGALVSAGIVTEEQLVDVEMEGPRHLEEPDDRLGFLGETIPLPTGQVIALADLVGLFGVALVISAVMRGRRITGGPGRRRTPARPPARRAPARRPPTRRPRRDAFRVPDQEIDLREQRARRPR